MDQQLDLKKIALSARNSEYNPKRFSAVVLRLREPKSTALVFSSGKIVCTGTKSTEDAEKACRKYAAIIKKIGFNISFKDYCVQNVVASFDFKFPIKLDELMDNDKHRPFV